MYCPKCGTNNLDGASFCRSCGANISLVGPALSGQLPLQRLEDDLADFRLGRRARRRRGKQPSIEGGIRSIFMGVAFIFVALAVLRWAPGGFAWGYWLFIPAATLLGGGVAEFMRAKRIEKSGQPPSVPGAYVPPQLSSSRPPEPLSRPKERNTGELVAPPPSVTEGTTWHLGAEQPTKVFTPTDPPGR
jgi:hypothetical protein